MKCYQPKRIVISQQAVEIMLRARVFKHKIRIKNSFEPNKNIKDSHHYTRAVALHETTTCLDLVEALVEIDAAAADLTRPSLWYRMKNKKGYPRYLFLGIHSLYPQ